MRKGFYKKLISTVLASAMMFTVMPQQIVKAEVEWGSYGVGAGTKWPEQVYAPFVDMCDYYSDSTIGNSGAAKLDKFYNDSGVRFFNLGFIQSRGKTSNDRVEWGWGGYKLLSEDTPNDEQYLGIKKSIRDIRALNGDVCVSFGGLNGVAFWQTTQDVQVLANTYIDIINGYGLTRIDLDVEGGAQNKAQNIENAKAIKIAQDKTGVDVVLTLPVLPDGLTSQGLGVLEAYLANGVKLKAVNIMTMCYGSGTIPEGHNYATASTLAVDALKDQIKDYYKKFASTTLSDSEAYSLIGTCPSVGYEGASDPVWYPEWSKIVTDHAISRGIGMITCWSMNRDAGIQKNSGIRAPYEHTKEFIKFGSQDANDPNKAPELFGVEDKIIQVGTNFNPLEGVTAKDAEDGDLTNQIKVSGTVDTSVEGDYTLSYIVTDSQRKTAAKTIVVKVRVDTSLDAPLYDPTKVYNTGDIVAYKGALYKCLYWAQGNQPDISSNWEKITSGGGDITNPEDKSEDVNKDGKVDIADLALVASKYNKKSTDSAYDASYDINGDKIIDIYDLVMVAKKIDSTEGEPEEPENPTVTEWKVGVSYKQGDVVTYQGKQYKCLNGHTSIEGWTPNVVYSLWQAI